MKSSLHDLPSTQPAALATFQPKKKTPPALTQRSDGSLKIAAGGWGGGGGEEDTPARNRAEEVGVTILYFCSRVFVCVCVLGQCWVGKGGGGMGGVIYHRTNAELWGVCWCWRRLAQNGAAAPQMK